MAKEVGAMVRSRKIGQARSAAAGSLTPGQR